MNSDARILQHLEHGEHGRFVVVDHFGAEILERGWPDLGQGRLHDAKHIGQCVEDAADAPAYREPAAPRHARAERHDPSDLASSLNQPDAGALTSGCAGSAKPGGAAADNEDIGRYLPLYHYLIILSTAGIIISRLNAAATGAPVATTSWLRSSTVLSSNAHAFQPQCSKPNLSWYEYLVSS
jgi:hypothetical protein